MEYHYLQKTALVQPTYIGLLLLFSVHLGLHHCCLVGQVLVQAEALQDAGPSLLDGLGAGAGLLHLLRQALGQDLLVVRGEDLLDVGAGGVGHLESAPVEDFAQWAVFWETLVNQGQELSSNVCLDIH